MRFLDYFDNFLKSKRKYKENQAFWRLAIAIWCEEAYEEVLSDSAGNPILYVVFPHLKKSLKIIQRAKTHETLPFLAHIEKKEFDVFESAELIISLQLNKDTYQDTEKIFKAYICNEINNQQLERINGKYLAIW
jgi:hypothetical protein